MTYREHLKRANREYLRKLVRGRTITAAAKIAGVSRTHVYRLLRRAGLEPNWAPQGHRGDWRGV